MPFCGKVTFFTLVFAKICFSPAREGDFRYLSNIKKKQFVFHSFFEILIFTWFFDGFEAARRPRSRLRTPLGAPQGLLWSRGPSQSLFKGSPEASIGAPEGSQGRPSGVPWSSPWAHLAPGPAQGLSKGSPKLPTVSPEPPKMATFWKPKTRENSQKLPG